MTDYMSGQAALSDCLINTGYDSLVILPTHMPVDYSSEFLSSPRVDSLAQELKDRYPDRIVIYDLAPLLLTDDYLVFMQNVDACLLVIEEGATNKDDIERAVELLKDHGITANHLPIKWIVPFHGDAVTEIINAARRTIIVENNYSGQFYRFMRSETGLSVDGHIRKYDGEPFAPHHIVEGVLEHLASEIDVYVPTEILRV